RVEAVEHAAATRIGERLEYRVHVSGRRDQPQLLICSSPGNGVPLPSSSDAFRLRRKYPHFVLQWNMKSTGSRHVWLNFSTVSAPVCSRSKVHIPPTHSSGPPAQRQATWRSVASTTSMRALRSGLPKKNCTWPPAPGS